MEKHALQTTIESNTRGKDISHHKSIREEEKLKRRNIK